MEAGAGKADINREAKADLGPRVHSHIVARFLDLCSCWACVRQDLRGPDFSCLGRKELRLLRRGRGWQGGLGSRDTDLY